MHSSAGSFIYELRSGISRALTTHCLSSTIMVAVLSSRSFLRPRSTLHTRRGVSLCAMRINRHCKKNHSQSRQKLVGVHAVHSSTPFLVAEMAHDGDRSSRDRLSSWQIRSRGLPDRSFNLRTRGVIDVDC